MLSIQIFKKYLDFFGKVSYSIDVNKSGVAGFDAFAQICSCKFQRCPSPYVQRVYANRFAFVYADEVLFFTPTFPGCHVAELI